MILSTEISEHLGFDALSPIRAAESQAIWTVSDAPPYVLCKCGEAENNEQSAHVLGLHCQDGEIRIWNFVGAVWIDNNHALTSAPKPLFGGLRIDYIRMLLYCLTDSVVAEHLDNVFCCWPDEAPIAVEDQDGEVSILIALTFLRSLHALCVRHLRRNFIRITENLTGRIKGRILLGPHLVHNVLRGREDRVMCQFGTISDNCVENQILKAALERCAKLVSETPLMSRFGVVHQWIRNARMALADVEIRKITLASFRGVWYGGMFQHYREPHAYAKMVLGAIGLDPDAPAPVLDRTPKLVPPFALCTSELFERFCEVGLRSSGAIVDAGYTYREGNLGKTFKVRPDFLVRHGKKTWIADAKYKVRWTNPHENDFSTTGSLRGDVSQIVTYSRHTHVLRVLASLTVEGLILYPEPVLAAEWETRARWFGKDGPLAASRILPDDFQEPVLRRAEVPVPSRCFDDRTKLE